MTHLLNLLSGTFLVYASVTRCSLGFARILTHLVNKPT
jgi:hypothetical protein